MEVCLEKLKNKTNSRINVYRQLNLSLQVHVDSLPKETIDELVEIFNTDLLEGTNNALNSWVLSCGKFVLNRIKDNEDFKDSIRSMSKSIFKHLMTVACFVQAQVNQQRCWEMISSLNDATLVDVIDSNDKQFSNLILHYLNAKHVDNPMKELISRLLLRWLKMLSPEQLAATVAGSLNMWFGYHTSALILTNDNQRLVAVETMELILPYLKNIDYTANAKWIFILDDLKEKKRFTPFLSQLFLKKKNWTRIWCILLKLLERYLNENGLLMNSLLPVLEQAFREETTRKDAFECWSILIDHSVYDQNKTNNQKVIKLLCTPLTLNNAKTAEMALVKFRVWWLLITKLSHEAQTYKDIMLYPFLNFCFGINAANQQNIPGLVFPSLKTYTVSSLVEIFGHEESCTGCVEDEIVHLKNPILNNTLFDGAVDKWLKTVKFAIEVVSQQINTADKENTATTDKLKKKIKCIWVSLLKIMKGIVNPNILALAFGNLVDVLASLSETSASELVVDCFIPLMVKKDVGFSAEFLTDTSFNIRDNLTPLRLLILLLVSPKLYKFTWSETKLLPFKDIVCIELDKSTTDFLAWIFLHLNGSEPSVSLWCHLSEALTSPKYSQINEIHQVVLCWPLDTDVDLREITKINKFWRELYDFVAHKVISPKKKNRTSLEDELISKISNALETDSESKTVLAVHGLCTMIKHRSQNNPVGQVTNQPDLLKLLLQLLGIVKNFDAKDHIIGAVLEAAESMSGILGTYNSRKATPEYLILLNKSAEATLKTVDHCLQKTLFRYHCSEYSTKLAKIFPMFLVPAFSAVCCPLVNDIILTLSKKDEENMIAFKDVLQMVYKLENKKTEDFKSPQKKSSKASKVSKTETSPDSQDFVVIKSNWKFDPKNLTEHQKEVLTRRRENIPALYEGLSQSQDDFIMKTWKPAGYNNDETSDSSKESRDKSIGLPNDKPLEYGAKDDNEKKLVNGTSKETNVSFENVLRPFPVKDNESNKGLKMPTENVSMKLAIVASPKGSIKKTSFQSRLERNMQKLLEESAKLDDKINTITSPIVLMDRPNATTPISKNVSNNMSRATTPNSNETLEIPKSVEIFPIVQINEGVKDHPVTPSNSKAPEACTLNMKVTPVNNQNDVKSCESERPVRQKKQPNKFDMYDVGIHGKRRASTSICELMRASHYSSDSESVTSNSQECEDATPTKIKKRKMRLLKNLEIDTVDGHPFKDMFKVINSPKTGSADENHKPTLKRRRSSVLAVDRHPKEKTLKSLPKNRRSIISDQINSESSDKLTESAIDSEIISKNKTLPESDVENGKTAENCISLDATEEIIISDEPVKTLVDESVTIVEPVSETPIEVTDHSEHTEITQKPTVIELSDAEESDVETNSSPKNISDSQDIIQSSQDSLTNVSVTPKRISMIINGKAKTSSCNSSLTKVISEPVLSVVVIPDTQVDDILDTADLDTLPVTNASVAEIDMPVSSSEVSPETMEVETQTIDDIQDLPADEIEENPADEIEENAADEMGENPADEIEENPTDEIEENPADEIEENLRGNEESHFDDPIVIEELDDEMNELADRSTILSSPFEHDMEDRNAELLNNTLDISPIKIVDQDNLLMEDNELESLGCKVLSDDDSTTDNDIASSPADSRKVSPVKPSEILSNLSSLPKLTPIKKLSPPLRNQDVNVSPPKEELMSSPSTSKNKNISYSLNHRFGGRAAQMVGMCQRGPESAHNKFSNVNSLSPVRMIARKNLHSVYNNDNTLELSKPLPSPYASPTGSILKKPHDESIPSPSSGKKKRVSFHDPPVSMTLNVEKYLESNGSSSPQQPKAGKSYANEQPSFMKQSKVVLCLAKKIESVEQSVITGNSDEANLSELCSLETNTQEVVDVINNHLLDDEHPIFPTLAECQIPITEIASELTSIICKEMFLNEIKDEIQTIGDLAKLTELQVNRLPICFPKVDTVKRVFSEVENTMKREEAVMELEKTLESEQMDVVDPELDTMGSNENSMDSAEVAEPSPQSLEFVEMDVVDRDSDTMTENSMDSIEVAEQTTQRLNISAEETAVKIEMDGQRLDFNNDEHMIQLLDKLLQKRAVSDYLSQNIQKYFTLNLQLLPPETKFS